MFFYSEGFACELAKQILDGVLYLHTKSVVHLDIRPENLLFDFNKEKVILIDFGSAVDLTCLGNVIYKIRQLFK